MEIQWYNIDNDGEYHHNHMPHRHLFFIQSPHLFMNISFCKRKNCHFESVGIWEIIFIVRDLLIILLYQNMCIPILFNQSVYNKNTLILCDHIMY